jgi:hypothetical protein
MPAAKKQKKGDSSANGCESVQSILTPASQQLPGEILQTVFRESSFLDLLRCMRVCKVWRAYLPGDDPALNETLFLKIRNMRAEPLKLEFEMYVWGQRYHNGALLPKGSLHHANASSVEKACLHPIAERPQGYFDVFNKNVTTLNEADLVGVRSQYLVFPSLAGLSCLTKNQTGAHYRGCWASMQLFRPAATEVEFFTVWRNARVELNTS